MPTDRKTVLVVLLTLIITVTVQYVGSSKVLTLSDESDDENTLRQALYLVKLLKSGTLEQRTFTYIFLKFINLPPYR